MPLLLKRITAAFALLALLAMQSPAGTEKFVCDCTGKSFVTQDEHCHGENGSEGPLSHAPIGHRHHNDDPKDGLAEFSGHHHHQVLTTPTDVDPMAMPVVYSSPVASVVWLEVLELAIEIASEPKMANRSAFDDVGPPQLPLLVVRSIVFLV